MYCLNPWHSPAKKAWKSFTSKLFNKSKSNRSTHAYNNGKRPRKKCKYLLKKKTAPAVYVDKLFVEHVQVPTCENRVMKVVPAAEKKAACNTDDAEAEAEAEAEAKADEMWESLGLASPQMYGIDERAEEFITRFRAEMQLQEIMARLPAAAGN